MASLVAPLTSAHGWVELVTLMFLELALGVDNLVFIAITSDRLPKGKQHVGRRLGLLAAMLMRIVLLCCIVWIMSINVDLFTLPFGAEGGHTTINVHDMIFLVGGVYLVYKGVAELKEAIAPPAAVDEHGNLRSHKTIGLGHAVGLIMVMDIVFSLDSVITAAGLSGQLLVMILAVIGAVAVMIVFADPIADFINGNPEIKVVALLFITLIGVMLLAEGLHVETVFGAPLNVVVYAMMVFGIVVALCIMQQRRACERTHRAHARGMSAQVLSPENGGEGPDAPAREEAGGA